MKKIILLMIMIITFATSWGQNIGVICYRNNGSFVQCPPQMPKVDTLFFCYVGNLSYPEGTTGFQWSINDTVVPYNNSPCLKTDTTMYGKPIMVTNNMGNTISDTTLLNRLPQVDGNGTIHTDSIYPDSVTLTAVPGLYETFLYWSTSTGCKSISDTVRCTNTITCLTADAVNWTAHFVLTVSLPTATITYSGSPWCTSAGPQNVTGTAGGTYSVHPNGLSIDAITGQITPTTSTAGTYTVTCTVSAEGGCLQVTDSTQVTITALPSATISYTGSPWCTSASAQAVSLTGIGDYTGGVYTSTAGLTLNSSTGQFTPNTSTAGFYTVTYTLPASGGCPAVTATTSVEITALPTATISYIGSSWCTTASSQLVTLTGTNAYIGGTYSSAPGINLNTSTGQIDPSTSTSGTYTITYTAPASGGCPAVPATTNVTITALPTAAISYTGSPWYTTAGTQAVTLTGANNYTGGTYSSTTGLSVNATTGLITPSNSIPGAYTVTYTIPTFGGCPAVTATDTVTVKLATSISENKEIQSSIILYPNPAESVIHFNEGEFFIFDISGKVVISGNASSADVSNLKAGTYLFKSGKRSTQFMIK
jgi:hypothetical protein